ncbi:cupin domain-containing protein [Nocardia stercoris]|uniref:Cupin domain-containing protein n=1 Tax=Nocardia stercoris TaxID=2483361 RepID=A0A3M2KUY5_9NOCA|nr:cupin domain-containing protein [Nocardia stercoris]RMI28804.1 cupin domain-containing protein [Nocardia stercoris]
MSGEHLNKTARRVIAGVDSDGRSTIVADEVSATRVALPAFTVNDVWRMDSLPGRYADDDTLSADVELDPPAKGLVVRLATFPPDSEIDSAVYTESIGNLHGEDANADSDGIVGLHATETIDIATILDGEIYAIYETGETLLRPGDTVINRGIKHAWSNRTDKPVTMVAVMLPATN